MVAGGTAVEKRDMASAHVREDATGGACVGGGRSVERGIRVEIAVAPVGDGLAGGVQDAPTDDRVRADVGHVHRSNATVRQRGVGLDVAVFRCQRRSACQDIGPLLGVVGHAGVVEMDAVIQFPFQVEIIGRRTGEDLRIGVDDAALTSDHRFFLGKRRVAEVTGFGDIPRNRPARIRAELGDGG